MKFIHKPGGPPGSHQAGVPRTNRLFLLPAVLGWSLVVSVVFLSYCFFFLSPDLALTGNPQDSNLSPFRLLLQKSTDWVAYKHQKYVFHSSGDWEA